MLVMKTNRSLACTTKQVELNMPLSGLHGFIEPIIGDSGQPVPQRWLSAYFKPWVERGGGANYKQHHQDHNIKYLN